MTYDAKHSLYTSLAHEAATHFVKHGQYLPLDRSLPPQLSQQQACFVTAIEKPGRRAKGIMGNALPTQPTLAHEIVVHTIAALKNGGGRTVTKLDLQHTSFEVALLGTLQRVSAANHLNPEVFGLYVTSDQGKGALILPKRMGVYTADDQLATALREAKINTQNEAYFMYRFAVQYYNG